MAQAVVDRNHTYMDTALKVSPKVIPLQLVLTACSFGAAATQLDSNLRYEGDATWIGIRPTDESRTATVSNKGGYKCGQIGALRALYANNLLPMRTRQ